MDLLVVDHRLETDEVARLFWAAAPLHVVRRQVPDEVHVLRTPRAQQEVVDLSYARRTRDRPLSHSLESQTTHTHTHTTSRTSRKIEWFVPAAISAAEKGPGGGSTTSVVDENVSHSPSSDELELADANPG